MKFPFKRTTCILFFLAFCSQVQAQTGKKTENVVLLTFDGLRWQEVFKGADSTLLFDKESNKGGDKISAKFWKSSIAGRRETLLPFFWNTIASKGQLYGNRAYGNKVNVSNTMWFSYPGYNEILTGFADDKNIASNDKIKNPNVTVLEFINNNPRYKGKVAAFTSWDVFPFIINEERCGIPVNSGNELQTSIAAGAQEKLLNSLVNRLPQPWDGVRYDGLTFSYAKEYMERLNPKVTYISFDETDDYAHDGKYDQYLLAAHRIDGFIQELWSYIESAPAYKGKTTLIITTDHGRGDLPGESWRHHGKDTKDSDQIWLAVLGPDTPSSGEMKEEGTWYQNQVAATLAAFLKLTYSNVTAPGLPVKEAYK